MIRKLLVGIVAALLLLTGCTAEQSKDAPREDIDDNSPALVLRMPDGFSNVATKCIPHTHIRVATIYHWSNSQSGGSYGSVALVQDDSCK